MKVLVIAPHPDDEVLGCGGTIKKHAKAGDQVHLCIVTKAYTPDWTKDFLENRKCEIKKATELLGIKKIFLLDFPTVKLDTVSQKSINDALLKVVEEVKPDIAFIPFFGDINKDHKIVSEASLVALRPKPNSTCQKIFCYEVLSETEWANPPKDLKEVFLPNFYEDVSDFIEDKLKAMQAYESELKEYPHPRSQEGIKILAQKRGMEVAKKYAEAFMLVREIK